MSDGQLLLDSSGNVKLNASGQRILDSATGTGCCCGGGHCGCWGSDGSPASGSYPDSMTATVAGMSWTPGCCICEGVVIDTFNPNATVTLAYWQTTTAPSIYGIITTCFWRSDPYGSYSYHNLTNASGGTCDPGGDPGPEHSGQWQVTLQIQFTPTFAPQALITVDGATETLASASFNSSGADALYCGGTLTTANTATGGCGESCAAGKPGGTVTVTA